MYGFYAFIKLFLRIEEKLDALLNVNMQILEHTKRGQLVEVTDHWLDNQEVMQQLHISDRTLFRLRSSGQLPYTRINRKFYYRQADIQRMLQETYRS